MNLIIDANVAIRMFVNGKQDVTSVVNRADKVFAPQLYNAEVGNTILQYIKHGYISLDLGKVILSKCLDVITDYYEIGESVEDILTLSMREQLSYYDAIYLHFATSTQIPLLSFDKKLNSVAQRLNLAYEI